MPTAANTPGRISASGKLPASEGHIPLLAHWQDQGLIPSIDLLAIMTAHKSPPQI